MSKINSKSLNIGDFQEDILKQHIQRLMELSESIVNDKLQRQEEKQRRVQAVEQQFVSWAGKKQSQIREKLQKSTKLKEDHINKIVKKCKDNQKYLGEKLRNFQNKKKESLRQAWKMTQKYKNDLDQDERMMVKSKTINNTKSLAQSQSLYRRKISIEKKKQFQISSYGAYNFTKKQDNKEKISREQLNKIRQRKNSQQIHFLTEGDQQYQEKEAKHFQQKLQQAFTRFKHNLAEDQQSKIQQLGERLERIQNGRNRKFQIIKKKKEKYRHFNENDHHERRDKKANKSQRVQSESVMREKRVRDWSEANKNKREQFFQSAIQNGSNYLQNSKIKFLKTAIAKKIALSTIEKKLYLQRLKH